MLSRYNIVRTSRSVLIASVIIFILTIFLFPTIWIILTSIRPMEEINAVPPVWIPQKLTLEHYVHAIFGYSGFTHFSFFPRYLFNSFVSASISTAIALIAGSLSGYCLSRFNFRGKNVIFLLILLTRAIPGIALSLPLYILFMRLGLLDTLYSLIITYSVLNLPFVTWMMEGFFREVPREVDEAAFIDGCSKWSAFWRISLPLTKSGIIASATLIFMLAYNEFPVAFVITASARSRTVSVGLYEFMHEFYIDWGGMSAAGTITLIPIVILTLIIQKYIMRGLTFGAVKG